MYRKHNTIKVSKERQKTQLVPNAVTRGR